MPASARRRDSPRHDSSASGERGHFTGHVELTFRDLVAILRRRLRWVLIPLIVVPVGFVALALTQPKQYRATADVLVRDPPVAGATVTPARALPERVLQNELQRASGSAIQDQVRGQVGPEVRIAVGLAAADADVFVFSAESSDPELAADAANTYAEVYLQERQDSQTRDLEARADVIEARIRETEAAITELGDIPPGEPERQALQAQLNNYRNELETIEVSMDLVRTSGAAIIDAAAVPGSPFSPRPLRAGAIGLAIGLSVGLLLAWLIDRLDDTLRDEEALAEISESPVLAVIPKVQEWQPDEALIVTRTQPSSSAAEAYRALRTSLQFAGVDRPLRIVQITSPTPADGKTTTITNLGVVCARTGQRVVIVDCDLRRPRIHRFLNLSNEMGFTSAVLGTPLAMAIHPPSEEEPNLSVLTAGPLPPNPSEMLSSNRARAVFEALAQEYDLVLVDSPPVLLVSDPMAISAVVDGVILVAAAGAAQRRDVVRAVDHLRQIDAPLIGTVLNGFEPDSLSRYYYRYSYGDEQPSVNVHSSVAS